MAMRDERARARRLEAEAREAPGRYRLRLLALALLGYGVIVGLLLLALAPFAMVALHLAVDGAAPAPAHVFVLLLPAVVAVVVIRTLWVRFGPPDGHLLAAGEAPELQAEVERLRRAMQAPPLDGILVDGEFNAKAARVPRALGLLGHRHYLVLGLPLMRVLDRDELAAVIAHEFGHFGAHDDRFAAWIHLSGGTWHRLREGMARHDFAFAFVLARFYAWLAPRFDLASRALARRHEYAADAAAARAVGADLTASALLRVEIAARRLQARFWPGFWARARGQAHPPAQLQAPLVEAARGGEVDLERLLAVAARARQDPFDSHPSLPQRLGALQAPSALRSAGPPAAALLGPLEDTLERRLDAAWRDAVRADWSALHAAAAGDRARLAELDGTATPGPEQLAEHALLVEQVRIDLDPLPLHERALAADPQRVLALFRAGLLRLRRGEAAAGAAQLRRAVELDPGAARPLLEELQALEGDPDLDPATCAAIDDLRGMLAPLADERAGDPAGDADALLPHGLDAGALDAVVRRLACEPRVARAWIVRRPQALREAPPQFLVLLDWRGPVAGEGAGLRLLAEALGPRHALFTGSNERALARQVRAVCGEPVYRKGRA